MGAGVHIDCPATAHLALHTNFAAMASPSSAGQPPAVAFRVTRRGPAFIVSRIGQPPRRASSLADLLSTIERDLTLALQRRRPDLLFLHAAAVEWRGKALLLAAASGGGKSTLTWAMLHHGFGYLSDELSPIDSAGLQVLPYPHALCLKQPSPPPYFLPGTALHLGRTIHVPPHAFAAPTITRSRPVAAIFFLCRQPDPRTPTVRPISAAEAGARLYANALNLLAHADRGFAPVLTLACAVPCYAVSTANLRRTCCLLRSVVSGETTC
jgi:hypothetical protein